MIAKTLKYIVDNLNDYLDDRLTGPPSAYRAEITNIQKSDNGSEQGIKVALINVEEDKVYKNHLLPLEGRPHNSTDPIHPLGGTLAMRVNLYVLLAFNPQNVTQPTLGYLNSLSIMTHVLRYFHSNPFQEVPLTVDRSIGLEIEYHNVNLEDSNNMWSNLGGEQKPYAMYKIKMLEVLPDDPDELSEVIRVPPIISDPDLDPAGNTLFNPDGTPQQDKQQIKHLNKNN